MVEKSSRSVFSGVLLALIVFFVVLPLGGVVTCVACAKFRADQREAASASSAVPPLPASASAAAPLRCHFAFAVFDEGNTMTACLDRDLGEAELQDAGGCDQARDRRMASVPDAGNPPLRLEATCEATFADRPVLAQCSYAERGTEIRYYTFEMLTDDEQFRTCVKDKGKWTALPRDSDAYKQAKMEYDLAKAQKEAARLRSKYGN